MTIKNNKIPCMLCGKLLKVRLSKSDKPYFICNICGLQTFIRYGPGIKKLKMLLADLIDNPSNFMTGHKQTLDILALINDIRELKEKLDDLKENKSFSDYLFPDSNKEVVQKLLENKIKETYRKLVKIRKLS